MSLSDYVRVKGSGRRYVNSKTGQEISRWDYDKMKHGGLDARAIAKTRKAQGIRTKNTATQNRLNGFIKSYKANTARKKGIKPSKVKVRGNSEEAKEFRKLYKELMNLNREKQKIKNKKGDTNEIDERIKKQLEDLNMRDPEWQYPVSHSP